MHEVTGVNKHISDIQFLEFSTKETIRKNDQLEVPRLTLVMPTFRTQSIERYEFFITQYTID